MRLTCKPENRAMQQDVNRFGCARQYSTRKEISTCFLDRRCRLLIGFVFRLLHKLQKLVVALGAGAAQKFESTVENAREILRPAVPPPDLFALRPAFSHSVRQQTNINTLQSIATSFLTSIQFDLLNTTSNRNNTYRCVPHHARDGELLQGSSFLQKLTCLLASCSSSL